MPDSTSAAVRVLPTFRLTNFSSVAASLIIALLVLPFVILGATLVYSLFDNKLPEILRMTWGNWAIVTAIASPFLGLMLWCLSYVTLWLRIGPDGFTVRRLLGGGKHYLLSDLTGLECTDEENTIAVGARRGVVRTRNDVTYVRFAHAEFSFVTNRRERDRLRAHAEAYGWSDRLTGSSFAVDAAESPAQTQRRRGKQVLIALSALLPVVLVYLGYLKKNADAKAAAAEKATAAQAISAFRQTVRTAEEFNRQHPAVRLAPPEFVTGLPAGPAQVTLRGEIANTSAVEIIAFRFRITAKNRTAQIDYASEWYLRCSVAPGTTQAFTRTIRLPSRTNYSATTPPELLTFTVDDVRAVPRNLVASRTALLEEADLLLLLDASPADEVGAEAHRRAEP